jgi:hypothetical protein
MALSHAKATGKLKGQEGREPDVQGEDKIGLNALALGRYPQL